MASDAIEREFRNYAELKRPMRADADALVTFRAGYLACRKMAVDVAMQHASIEGIAQAIAAALEKLGESPDSLRAEDEGGR